MNNCKHYDEEFDCCKILSDWSDPMPVLQPCVKGVCEKFSPVTNEICKNCEYFRPLENDPKKGRMHKSRTKRQNDGSLFRQSERN